LQIFITKQHNGIFRKVIKLFETFRVSGMIPENSVVYLLMVPEILQSPNLVTK